jgi:hypothetical protein
MPSPAAGIIVAWSFTEFLENALSGSGRLDVFG